MPPSSPRSAPPSPPGRFSTPVLYRPLATPPPWLGFRAGLRRRVSGGPRSRSSSVAAAAAAARSHERDDGGDGSEP